MKIKTLSIFVDAKTLKPIEQLNLDGDMVINKPFSPMILDKETAESLNSMTENGGAMTEMFSLGNFIISILIGGSLQQLWGMIRALQMVVLVSLVDINFPWHARLFLESSVSVAQLDVFQGENIIDWMFRFKQTSPINSNFENFGADSQNFMLNSGSYFIFIVVLLLMSIGRYIINRFAVWFSQKEWARKIGMWNYSSDSNLYTFTANNMKLYMESYFDLAFCTLLGMTALVRAEQLEDFFLTHTDRFCSILTLVYAICMLAFPVLGQVVIWKNKQMLNRKKVF